MDKQSMANRIVELAETIQYHADLYYNRAKTASKSDAEITDAEYDSLVDDLKNLVAALEQLDHTAPEVLKGKEVLSGIGSTPSYGRKVTHSQKMGSLDKATSFAQIVEWYKRYATHGGKIVVMPKIDGCFRSDQKVMMANGEERPISEIKEGMSVLSFNEKTGKTEPKKVLSILVRKSDVIPAIPATGWMLLKFTGGKEIVCTVDHPFLTSNRGWVPAQDLTKGDSFVEPEFSS